MGFEGGLTLRYIFLSVGLRIVLRDLSARDGTQNKEFVS
jgi:hypothetical protein